MSRALNRVDERGKRAIGEVERKAIRQLRRNTEQAILDAAEINDNGLTNAGLVPEGWDESRHRRAMDLRKDERHAPVYSKLGVRLVESADRLAAARDTGPKVSLNIGQIVHVQPLEYKVIDVDAKDR